ncbi:hypothetical protein PGQ11_010193 [Apiospora arundinis]|uniref:Uncharacterized protein n=1 Tax=Apiospora arundinis TaxID=335852 RepID=A0ABR2I9R5_9PEZI
MKSNVLTQGASWLTSHERILIIASIATSGRGLSTRLGEFPSELEPDVKDALAVEPAELPGLDASEAP